MRLGLPNWISFDWRAGLLSVLAALILFGLKWSVFRMLAILAALGLALGSF